MPSRIIEILLILILSWLILACQRLSPPDSVDATGDSATALYGTATYKGNITFHEDLSDNNRKYVYLVKADGTTKIQKLTTEGLISSFSLTVNKPEKEGKIQFYALYDTDYNEQVDAKKDKLTFLMLQNDQNDNLNIEASQVKISGQLDNTSPLTLNRFDFSAATPPILAIEDRSYWVAWYQSLESNGKYAVYINKNHLIDLLVYDVYLSATDQSEKRRLPVRIFGNYDVTGDMVVLGVDSAVMKIHSIKIAIENNQNYPEHNLLIKAGQIPLEFQLFDDNNLPVKAPTFTKTSFTIHFRDFDRTTSTNGILNDSTSAALVTGFGAFYSVQAFIDRNSEGILNPEDLSSNKYYHGDGDNDGTPGSAPAGKGDYNDDYYDSKIIKDMDFTGTSLVIP